MSEAIAVIASLICESGTSRFSRARSAPASFGYVNDRTVSLVWKFCGSFIEQLPV